VIDTLGGITIYVPYTFDDNYYPIKGKEDDPCGKPEEEIEALTATMSGDLLEKEFECRYEHLHFDKGVQNLDSENALKFVRSRHSSVNGGDFGRALRQQAFLEAIKDELLSISSIKKIIPILSDMSRNVKTDINLTEVYKLLLLNGDIGEIKIYSISLNDDNVFKHTVSADGQYTLIPLDGEGNYERIRSYVDTQIEKSFIMDEDNAEMTVSPEP
jgi:anionic cell wall polymer biosynthesis LytR-Cps2A-Psr (LCP) family protein